MKWLSRSLLGAIVFVFLAGCGTQVSPTAVPPEPTNTQPPIPTEAPTIPPTETPIDIAAIPLNVWIDPATPEALRQQIQLPADATLAQTPADANLTFGPAATGDNLVPWIYALVTPFSSLMETASFDDLKQTWGGQSQALGAIMVSPADKIVLESILGPTSPEQVQEVPAADLLDTAWAKRDVFAIVPFENLEDRWKVVSLNDQSPISNQFDQSNYPLIANFGWSGDLLAMMRLADMQSKGELMLASNRDPGKLTVLVMTGVTALVRATAVKMEENGMTYPGQDIHDWLANADLTHISNEIAFDPRCPDPKYDPYPLIFCSKPEYIQLLEYVGADIIDMTGNHMVDFGRDDLELTFQMYKERGWYYYAAGENVEQARDAVIVEDHGNKFAFMGCNPAGPDTVWATETLSGVANCDYDYIVPRIQELTAEGYQVIFTFQYFETYRHWAEPFEEADFRRVADAGAVIVSGSQAHHPMMMEFHNGSFIHYGLGNLFFDQMWVDTVTIPQGTRKEFIDRHVFYNGKHISTELLTAFLEDYSRPRPMTTAERLDFLKPIFTAAGWGPYPDN